MAFIPTVTDNFPGTALSANWTIDAGGFSVASTIVTGTVSAENSARYTGASFISQNQGAQITFPTGYDGNDYHHIGTNLTGSLASSGYVFYTQGGNAQLFKAGRNGTLVASSTGNVFAAGDTILLTAVAGALIVYHNGVQILTYTDSSPLSGGTVGMDVYRTSNGILTNQFEGGFVGFSISGNAGVAGATVAYSGAASGSVTADGSGNYTIPGLLNGAYTITPSKTGYTFSPTSANETLSGSNITGVNFTATPVLYSISGNAGVAGATVAWNGTSSGSTTADGSGNYTISGLANGPYTITPSKTGYTFSPTSASEIVSGSNITGVNFTASSGPVVLYSVSGNAGVAGATVTYTGASSGSVVSDSTGTYTVFLTAGTYTFTPSLATYTFSPVSKSVTVVASNVYGVNFTAKTFASPWSEVDSRDYGEFPNSTVDVQNTQFYIVPAHPSHAPPVDSRVTKPKDCRKSPNIPLNSRTNPPFES